MTKGGIARHKTALHRPELSRPMKLASEDGFLPSGTTVLDYGCGHGGDVRRLRKRGVRAVGWDPVHRPEGELRESELVNIGYVINVIENPGERADAVRRAWDLSQRVLVVSARLQGDVRGVDFEGYEDGCLTGMGTFQKFYRQSELRAWIGELLDERPVPAAPGVFYVFRDDALRQQFVARRYRRHRAAPQPRQSDILFERHRQAFDELIAFMADRGRSPAKWELEASEELIEATGSIKRALLVVRRVTGDEGWDAIAEDRAQDLLIHLALSRFDVRPKYGELADDLRLDVRAFFTSYKAGCELADALLYSLGDVGLLSAECAAATSGKVMPMALYFHVSALPEQSTLVRLYEGCARSFVGEVGDANIVKLSRERPKVSYLSYPDFDTDPHPVLVSSLGVDLQTFKVRRRRFDRTANPPLLHRKELFLGPEHPLRPKFERLTRQEERWGLYDDPSRIGTVDGWENTLRRWGAQLRGHRVVRRAEAGD